MTRSQCRNKSRCYFRSSSASAPKEKKTSSKRDRTVSTSDRGLSKASMDAGHYAIDQDYRDDTCMYFLWLPIVKPNARRLTTYYDTTMSLEKQNENEKARRKKNSRRKKARLQFPIVGTM